MIRFAVQSKGRLNEESLKLLKDSGIDVDDTKRKFIGKASDFPLELLYLRDDDIPGVVAGGSADIGIVGFNEIAESGADVNVVRRLGFGKCRLSLAIPKNADYNGLEWFEGRSIATSYPSILRRFLQGKGISSSVREIRGSVEIAPAAGIADSIFDIVSSGGTLVSNGLKEVESVLESEAVLICRKDLPEELPFLCRAGEQGQEICPYEYSHRKAFRGYVVASIHAQSYSDAPCHRGLEFHPYSGG